MPKTSAQLAVDDANKRADDILDEIATSDEEEDEEEQGEKEPHVLVAGLAQRLAADLIANEEVAQLAHALPFAGNQSRLREGNGEDEDDECAHHDQQNHWLVDAEVDSEEGELHQWGEFKDFGSGGGKPAAGEEVAIESGGSDYVNCLSHWSPR